MQHTTPKDERPRDSALEIRIPHQVLIGVAAGAGLMYFLDPQSGRHRRTMLHDRTGAIVRRAGARMERVGTMTGARAYGLKQKVTHLRHEDMEAPNDPDLVARVESEVFRDPSIPKGSININAVHEDTVVVRGEVESEAQIRAIARAIKRVHGVRRVENLLHLPGTPAPNKEAAVEASQHVPPMPDSDYEITHHG